MSSEEAVRVFDEIAKQAPGVHAQSMALAGAALNARPQFILKQKPAQRAETIRKVMARVRSNDLAEEALATYFIDCRRELLVAWLDLLGLEHEEGILSDNRPKAPETPIIREAVEKFRAGDEGEPSDRELLLRAFAAQTAIDWSDLETAIGVSS
jgi:hypothetical protein